MSDSSEIIEKLEQGAFDQLDLGCSNGSALEYGRKHFSSSRGLGVDLDGAKVKSARESGYDAVQFDATSLSSYKGCVSFVTMFHFLEHLERRVDADACIQASVVAARDFVFIRQPWFDSDGTLAEVGLKFYWSDWTGHTFSISVLDLYKAVRNLAGVLDWRIYGNRAVRHSNDPALIPLKTAADQHVYDKSIHGEKPEFVLPTRAFRESVAIIRISDKSTYSEIEKELVEPYLLLKAD